MLRRNISPAASRGQVIDLGEVGVTAKELDETSQPPVGTQGEREEGSKHMEVCPRCGQSFDNRLLHQVIYHDQPGHKPIELNSPKQPPPE